MNLLLVVIFSVSKLKFEIKSSPGKKNVHVNLTSYGSKVEIKKFKIMLFVQRLPYRLIKSRCLVALKWRLSEYFRPCTHSAGKTFF